MNWEKAKFWVTCTQCGRKFGIRSKTVLKYVDRLFSEMEQEIGERAGRRNKVVEVPPKQ